MKYYIITLLSLFTAVGLTSCVSDGEDIGAPIEITADYDLSQGGASDADKARIKDLYDKYGSYFLYDVSYKDAMWKQVAGAANESAYKITMGNPANVGAYLDYLNDIWLKYFPDSFLKNGGIPYKVVMADTLSLVKDYGSSGIYYYPQQYLIVGNTIILPGMNSARDVEAPGRERARRHHPDGLADAHGARVQHGAAAFGQDPHRRRGRDGDAPPEALLRRGAQHRGQDIVKGLAVGEALLEIRGFCL